VPAAPRAVVVAGGKVAVCSAALCVGGGAVVGWLPMSGGGLDGWGI